MPDWRQYVRERLPGLRTRPEREAEVIEEIAQQLESTYEAALCAGADANEAAREAEREIGNWQQFARDIEPPLTSAEGKWQAPYSAGSALDQFKQDLRFGLRLLHRRPAYALFTIGVIALGIGINTAVFSLVYSILFRPLPYSAPERLVAIDTVNRNIPDPEPWTSFPDLADLRLRVKTLQSVAGISPVWNVSVQASQGVEVLESLYVSAELFPMCGVQPVAGRWFTAEEDRPGKAAVVMLGHGYWQRRFAGSREAIGQKLEVEGTLRTIVGVLPAGFRYLGHAPDRSFGEIELWLPLSANPLANTPRSLRALQVAGLLRPGVTVAQADSEISALGQSLSRAYPATNLGFAMSALPMTERVTGKVRPAMILLLGAIGLVLLIACANLANLLLTRMSGRRQELSVRIALGASGRRIVQQILTESLLLAVMGALAGWGLAHLLVRVLVQLSPASLPRRDEIQLDAAALCFAVLVALAAAVLPVIAPALTLLRRALAGELRHQGRASQSGAALRRGLVVAEIAIAIVLLSGAGLLLRSFVEVLETDTGFRKTNLITMSTQMPSGVRTPRDREATLRRMTDALKAVPGVLELGAVSRLPLAGANLSSWLAIEGRPASERERKEVEFRRATGSYFSAMGIPLRQGRLWDEHDRERGANVALIDETLARRYFAGDNPLGRRIRLGDATQAQPWIEIIGVVGTVRHAALDTDPLPELYQPDYLAPFSAPILVLHTADAATSLESLRSAIRGVSPDIPVYKLMSVSELLQRASAQRRFVMVLVAGFAVLALLLAAVGLYGVMAQAVSQRTQEIGVRLAMGATRAEITRLVLQDGCRLAGLGLAAGLIGAALLSRLISTLLFGVRPWDPLTFTVVPATLLAAALLASFLPAMSASRVDPITALRAD